MKYLNGFTVLRGEADGADGGGAAAVDNTAALAALQTQIDALKSEATAKEAQFTAQLNEKDQAARYWHEEAKKKSEPKKDPPIETPEVEDDPIEVLSKEGMKGFERLAAKRGFVSAAAVDSKIETRAQQLTDEAALTKEYPELTDNKSEFFKATAAHYQRLVDAGTPQSVAMRQSANNAYLDGVKSGKIVTKAQQDEIDARAAAASGDKSHKGGKSDAAKDDDLDEFQKNICEQMGVDPAAYQKRAKAGVVYTGGNKF